MIKARTGENQSQRRKNGGGCQELKRERLTHTQDVLQNELVKKSDPPKRKNSDRREHIGKAPLPR